MTYRACTIQDESDFFHVQYEKRRVLLAAERKCLVTHHRVTCLLHFKRECTSFAHARVCVCVCVTICAQRRMCSGAFYHCSQGLFFSLNSPAMRECTECGRCAIFRSVSEASVFPYHHSVWYGAMCRVVFCLESSSLGSRYPAFSSVWLQN